MLTGIREHIPEGSTYIFEGPQRVGKTLAAVLFALDAHQNGRKVFSNIQLGFPHEPLQFSDIELETGGTRFWNGHVLIDELNFFFDCRASMSKENKKFGTYLLQQKKQGCNVTGTTHGLDYLDLRLRQNHDYLINPVVFPAYPEKPEILTMHVYGGPTVGRYYKKLRMKVAPFLGIYDSFAVYNPFKEAQKARK